MVSEVTEDVQAHLSEIERHVRAARGEQVEATPWEYRIPSGRDLRHLRETCGLSRDEVAAELGYAVGTVAQVEQGTNAPGREFIQQALRLYKREWPR